MADANKKRIIIQPTNAFENTLIEMINKHSEEFLDTVDKYSEENIDKIIEGADNILELQTFAVSKLEINKDKLDSNMKIRNKEAMVKEDKEKLVDEDNREAYKLLTEDEI